MLHAGRQSLGEQLADLHDERDKALQLGEGLHASAVNPSQVNPTLHVHKPRHLHVRQRCTFCDLSLRGAAARKCVEKRTRLAVKLEGIDEAALRHMKAQLEDEARRLVQVAVFEVHILSGVAPYVSIE